MRKYKQYPNRSPLIIAHRGARKEAPENTIPAFARAIELGADGIEFDVLLTRDKVPVVTHNDDLSILTNHKGFVRDMPLAAIKSLSAGFQIPTLAEALGAIRECNILAIAEIKAQPGLHAEVAEIIGRTIRDFGLRGPFMISSSSLQILRELKHSHPKIPRALIIRKKSFSFLHSYFFARLAGVSAIHPCLAAMSDGMVRRARGLRMQIAAWTANTPDDFERCLALGVDGIITDDVSAARDYIKKA